MQNTQKLTLTQDVELQCESKNFITISETTECSQNIYVKSSYCMFKMSTTDRGACVQTFAKVINSFVDRCLRQVIPDPLQCTF